MCSPCRCIASYWLSPPPLVMYTLSGGRACMEVHKPPTVLCVWSGLCSATQVRRAPGVALHHGFLQSVHWNWHAVPDPAPTPRSHSDNEPCFFWACWCERCALYTVNSCGSCCFHSCHRRLITCKHNCASLVFSLFCGGTGSAPSSPALHLLQMTCLQSCACLTSPSMTKTMAAAGLLSCQMAGK